MPSLGELVAPRRLGTSFRWLLGSSWTSNLGDGIALSAAPLLAHELFVLLEKNGTQKPMEKFGRDAYESDRDHERAA